jgi:predicted site-specific integrase-resolvase
MQTIDTKQELIPTLTAAEARKALEGISRATEHRWMRKGTLKPTHIGTRKLYKLSDINTLIEEGAA